MKQARIIALFLTIYLGMILPNPLLAITEVKDMTLKEKYYSDLSLPLEHYLSKEYDKLCKIEVLDPQKVSFDSYKLGATGSPSYLHLLYSVLTDYYNDLDDEKKFFELHDVEYDEDEIREIEEEIQKELEKDEATQRQPPPRESSAPRKQHEELVKFYTAETSTLVPLRKSPNGQSALIRALPPGSPIFLTSLDSGKYYRNVVDVVNDEEGYIEAKYLTNFVEVKVDKGGLTRVDGSPLYTDAQITIKNDSDRKITIRFRGKTVKLMPHTSQTVRKVAAGSITFRASAPGVMPYVTTDIIEGGGMYEWTFYIKTVFK